MHKKAPWFLVEMTMPKIPMLICAKRRISWHNAQKRGIVFYACRNFRPVNFPGILHKKA